MTEEFEAPVHVTVKPGEVIQVRSTSEASACLLRHWSHGCADEAYVVAMKSCLRVRAGLAEPAVAREAFIRAAEQAGMPVAISAVL